LREIDALVAEKVMGYPPAFNALAVPRFSSDIAAAWQVVEALRRDGFNFTLSHTAEVHGARPAAYFHKYAGEMIGVVFTETGNEPAEAICLAALKAKNKERS
jgi:hypothetical protein